MVGRRLLWSGIFCAAALTACDGDTSETQTAPDAGTIDSGGGGSGGSFCPDPNDPGVHFVSMDTTVCGTTVLMCTTDQNGFQLDCGCGCIDKGTVLCGDLNDPAITWISMDPTECGSMLPTCPLDSTPFNNSCGCGCTAH